MKHIEPCVIWFTGYSGAGKSSLAAGVAALLKAQGIQTSILDGDVVRTGLSQDLSYNKQDREENIRRVGHMARQLVDAQAIVLCAFISPFRESRNKVRALFSKGEFIEVFVDTSLEICEERDVKGLYKQARSGVIKDFTGIDSPYEKPLCPEVHIKSSSSLSLTESAQLVIKHFN